MCPSLQKWHHFWHEDDADDDLHSSRFFPSSCRVWKSAVREGDSLGFWCILFMRCVSPVLVLEFCSSSSLSFPFFIITFSASFFLYIAIIHAVNRQGFQFFASYTWLLFLLTLRVLHHLRCSFRCSWSHSLVFIESSFHSFQLYHSSLHFIHETRIVITQLELQSLTALILKGFPRQGTQNEITSRSWQRFLWGQQNPSFLFHEYSCRETREETDSITECKTRS